MDIVNAVKHYNMKSFKQGDKVYYEPAYGPKENGIVKEVRKDIVFVVYKCANNWDRYMDYTGQGTLISDLKSGWIEDIKLAKIRREIILMFIPFIGTWYVLNRIIPDLKLSWWNYSSKALPIVIIATFYQILFFLLLKFVLI